MPLLPRPYRDRPLAVAVAGALLAVPLWSVAAAATSHATAANPAAGSSAYAGAAPARADLAAGSPGKHKRPPAGLPADWPAGVAVPAGTVTGSTGRAGHWTVQLVAHGSAAAVRSQTMRFYQARGFRPVAYSELQRRRLHLVVVTANRDHSALRSILVLGLDRR